MKILFVSEDIPVANLGGAGKHAVLLGNTLLAEGHQVEMLGRLRAPGVETNNDFHGPLHADIDLARTGWKEHALGVFHALRRLHMAHRIWQAIQRRGMEWDVIHYHGHIPILGSLIPQNINFVHTLHDQGSECMTKIRFRDGKPCRARNAFECAGCATKHPNLIQQQISAHAVRSLRRHALTAFTRHQAIFVSQFLEDRYRASVGPAAIRSKVIHNFIDATKMQRVIGMPSSDGDLSTRPIVFLAGRIDRAKGFAAFFEALPDAILRSLRVVVAGDGPDLVHVKEVHGKRGIQFLGWQSLDSVLRATAEADVCVVPSIWEEPCGTTILEALALGRPVFALALGGTPELSRYQRYPGQLRLFENMATLVAALAWIHPQAPAYDVDDAADVRTRLPEIIATYESGRLSRRALEPRSI